MPVFFNELNSDEERWNYIENYFLGYDVLNNEMKVKTSVVDLSKSIDREHSYPANEFKKWSEMYHFFEESDRVIIDKLGLENILIPEYLSTSIKKSDLGDEILMSWPSKNMLISADDTSDDIMTRFENMGWSAFRLSEIDYTKLRGGLM